MFTDMSSLGQVGLSGELGRAHTFKADSTSDDMTEQFCITFHYRITCKICLAQIAALESQSF